MATVMVVDDADVRCGTLAGLLRRQGHETLAAEGPDHALYLLREAPRPPDLILVDVKMPGPSGPDLLEVLQADPKWRPVPVVMLTGYSDTHCVNRAAQLAAKRCPVKAAFSVADMMDCVRQYTN
jgi:CheY-like chemotaxis protein